MASVSLHKHSVAASSHTELRFHTPSPLQPGNEHGVGRCSQQVRRMSVAQDWETTPPILHVTLGCRNEQLHGRAWANHKQCTALQDSGDALLETLNPSDRDAAETKKKNWEEKEGREPIGSGTGASGTRHRNICSENLRFSVKSIMFSEHVLLLLLLLLDRRKALAGGKVNRHSLLYSGHFIHLVGLIKRQMLFLDI